MIIFIFYGFLEVLINSLMYFDKIVLVNLIVEILNFFCLFVNRDLVFEIKFLK